MLSMILAQTAQGNTQAGGAQSIIFWVVYIAFIVGIMYLIIVRPQRKQQKELDSVRDNLRPGDNIMTTGGFYGVVLDVVDDTVIVEFGNNKNCRIPMHKMAIAEVEHDEDAEENK